MIRLVHCSDLHIGVTNHSRPDSETGYDTTTKSFLECFDEIVDWCLDRNVDVFVFSGDAFKSRTPPPWQIREFMKRIRRLSDARIPSFLLLGNHDVPAYPRSAALDILGDADWEYVTIGSRIGTYTVSTSKGPLQILAVPWMWRQELLSLVETRLSLEKQNERLLQAGQELVRVPAFEQKLPTIISMHATIPGAILGSERQIMLGGDSWAFELDFLEDLMQERNISYIAAGHIHKAQNWEVNGRTDRLIAYSGSPNRVDFMEEGDRKGFMEVGLGWGGIERAGFHLLEKARKLKTIHIKITDVLANRDPLQHVTWSLPAEKVDVVRYRFDLPEDVPSPSIADVRRLLPDHIVLAGVEIERPQRPRSRVASTEPLVEKSMEDLLDIYMASKEVPVKRQTEIKSTLQGLV